MDLFACVLVRAKTHRSTFDNMNAVRMMAEDSSRRIRSGTISGIGAVGHAITLDILPSRLFITAIPLIVESTCTHAVSTLKSDTDLF